MMKTLARPLKFSTVVVTPRMIIISTVLLGWCWVVFFYLYREVNSFVSTPRLVIIKPADGSTVDGSSAHVVGVAEKDAFGFH